MEIAALKTGNKDYLKTITASSFKLSQLIEDDFFFSYCRLQIKPLKTCKKEFLKIMDRSFIFGQLIQAESS